MGKVILIGHPEDVSVVKHGSGTEKMTVIVTTDGKEPKKDYKTFTVVSSDSSTWTEKVEVADNDRDSSAEKTRYVIAKDGMVVSVEGSDEAKVKDLIKEIENKMGVNPDDSGKKETVTVETKKTVKK